MRRRFLIDGSPMAGEGPSGPPPSRPATLTEVAQRAGVSLTTASKAMNGRDRISEATRRRVLRAARDLAYAPNLAAKSLASGRSSIIGVLLCDPTVHRFAMPLLIGAQSVIEERDFSAIIADARGVESRLADLAVMLRQRSVDGLLVVGDNQGRTPSITTIAEIPCVYVHGPTTNHRDVAHVEDDFTGAVKVVEHLAELGRARLGHITGPENAPAVQQRVLGLTHALSARGLRLAYGPLYGSWSQRWARQAALQALAEAPDLDAIVCGSDQIAAAVLEVVVASGRRVPEEIAITGYDDWAVFAQETDPALTTYDMGLEQIGAAAVERSFHHDGGHPGRRRHPPSRGGTRRPGVDRLPSVLGASVARGGPG